MSIDESRVQSIYFAALDRSSPTERGPFLDSACGADVDLRRQVERLLSAQPRVGDFLQPGSAASVATVIGSPAHEDVGAVIGPYKLREVLGEGGMGTVYAAEQERPVRRKVALKVIKPGMDSRDVIARFEAERQALALMDHPNIAKVLDAGTTESGRPYFVMELVRGIPITDYCDKCNLVPKARLSLFMQVCRAVQHAHQKGIIHRDLKPSNVMVTLHDGVPVPKVIDFGVAKATHQKLTEHTIYTRVAQMVGTPLYMSPEQAEMSALDVDTRSDVYSLGVLLYELLTGMTPFDKETFSKASYDEVRRIIREDEPPRPSQRVSTLEAKARSTVSGKRGIDERKLTQALQGELDWIAMKALEKDRQRRYESASAFAADIQRYLDDQPVEACPPSAAYRLRKYARRNRTMLTTAIVVATALTVGTVLSVWQAMEAVAARNLADQNATLASERLILADQRLEQAKTSLANEKEARTDADEQRKQASANLQQALDAVDQLLTRVGDEKLRDIPRMQAVQQKILEDALNFYQGFLAEKRLDPHLRHRVAMAFYRMFWSLLDTSDPNDLEKVGRCLDEALRLLRELHEEFPDNGIYQSHLALVELDFLWRSPPPGRERRFRSIIQTLEQLLADPSPDLQLDALLAGATRHELAVVPRDVDQRSPRENVRQVLVCLLATAYFSLGAAHFDKIGDTDEAEAQLLKAIRVIEGAPGWNQWLIATFYGKLADVYDKKGRIGEAVTAFSQSLEFHRALLREEPNRMKYRASHISAHRQGANLYLKALQTEDAIAAARTALDAAALYVEDYPSARDWLNQSFYLMLVVLHRAGKQEELVALAEKGTDGEGWATLASVYRDAGDREAGSRAAEKALEINPRQLAALTWLAENHRDRGETVEALGFFDRVIAADPKAIAAWRGRAELMNSKRDFQAEAQSWNRSIELSPGEWQIYKRRATAYFRLGRFDEALADIATGVAMRPDDGSNLWCIPPADVGKCPSEAFRKGMLALADKAMDSTKGAAECRLARGGLRAAMGDITSAEEDFVAATKQFTKPSDLLDAHEKLVEFYIKTNQAEKVQTARARMKTVSENAYANLKSTAGGRDRETVQVMIRLAQQFANMGAYSKAISMFEEGLPGAKDVLGPADEWTLHAMQILGLLYRRDGQHGKAVPLLAEALETSIASRGANHPKTLQIRHGLARVYIDFKEPQKAVSLLGETVAGFGANLDEEQLRCALKLGDAWISLHESAKAIRLLEAALEQSKASLGADHRTTLDVMLNLGSAYSAGGEPAKAVAVFDDLRRTYEQQPAISDLEDEQNKLIVVNNLALAYESAGQPGKAAELQEVVLEKYKTRFGPEHPQTLAAAMNLADYYYTLGDVDKALLLLEPAVTQHKFSLGPDHPQTLAAINKLGRAYLYAGKPDKALPLAEEASETARAKLGPDHPQSLLSLFRLAEAYRDTERCDQALGLFEQVLEKYKKRNDADMVVATMQSVAWNYLQLGQFDKALPLMQEAVEKLTALHGPDHQDVLGALTELGDSYSDAAQFDKAVPPYERALAGRRALLGLENAETLYTATNLASAYQNAGMLDNSAPLLMEAYQAVERQSAGPARANYDWVLISLGAPLLKQQRYFEAENILRQDLANREAKSSDDWGNFSVRSALGAALAGQKRYAEAEPLLVAGYEGLKARVKKIPPNRKNRLGGSLRRLIDLYVAWDKPVQADQWRQELEALKASGNYADEPGQVAESQKAGVENPGP